MRHGNVLQAHPPLAGIAVNPTGQERTRLLLRTGVRIERTGRIPATQPFRPWLEEETALREVTARTRALGGRSLISVGEYPRMTYVCRYRRTEIFDFAAIRIAEDINSVVFPSATGAGRNVVVYLAAAEVGSVIVGNRDEVLAALRQPRAGKRSR